MQKTKKLFSLMTIFSVLFWQQSLSFAQEIQSNASLNVSGLKSTSIQSTEVSLEWTSVTGAEVYRVEYGKTPVVEINDKYELSKESNENKITIGDLTPNTNYYFSVVAFANNKTSVSAAYSDELNVKTLAGNTNEVSIEKIEVLNAGSVMVTFTEELLLPESSSQEINIYLLNTPTSKLGVTNVEKQQSNPKSLKINTEAQSPDARYVIEFSEAFVTSDNRSISESSRTDSFIGYNVANNNSTTGAMTGLKIDSINALIINGKSVVELDFNQPLTLDNTSLSKFRIVENGNPNNFLNIQEIRPNTQDDSKYLLITDDQKNIKYTLITTGVTSKSNQTMSDENSIVEFNGATPESTQNTDSGKTLKDLKLEVNNNVVTLKWTKPLATENIQTLNIYRSTDGGKNFALLSKDIDPNLESRVLSGVNPGNNVEIKVTLVSAGQESAGQILKMQISETGPETILYLALLLSLGYVIVNQRKNLQSLLNQSF